MIAPCVICGKEFESAGDSMPYKGTMFYSDGNYGSTVYDPMDGSYIRINLCDPCLIEAGSKGRVIAGRSTRPIKVEHMGVVGWEKIDRGEVEWRADLPDYDENDCVFFDASDTDEIDAYRDRSTFVWSIPPDMILDHLKKLS